MYSTNKYLWLYQFYVCRFRTSINELKRVFWYPPTKHSKLRCTVINLNSIYWLYYLVLLQASVITSIVYWRKWRYVQQSQYDRYVGRMMVVICWCSNLHRNQRLFNPVLVSGLEFKGYRTFVWQYVLLFKFTYKDLEDICLSWRDTYCSYLVMFGSQWLLYILLVKFIIKYSGHKPGIQVKLII